MLRFVTLAALVLSPQSAWADAPLCDSLCTQTLAQSLTYQWSLDLEAGDVVLAAASDDPEGYRVAVGCVNQEPLWVVEGPERAVSPSRYSLYIGADQRSITALFDAQDGRHVAHTIYPFEDPFAGMAIAHEMYLFGPDNRALARFPVQDLDGLVGDMALFCGWSN